MVPLARDKCPGSFS